jgi:hypothetical protein
MFMSNETKTEFAGLTEGAAYGAVNPYYAAARAKEAWNFTKSDTAFAVCAFALGMLFWDWAISPWHNAGVSVTLFFALAAAVTGT